MICLPQSPPAGPTPASHPDPFCRPLADRPAILIQEATLLWATGHPIPAAAIARGALHLRIRHRSKFSRYATIRQCLGHLLHVGEIDHATYRQLFGAHRVGSRIVHGRPASFDAIDFMLRASRTFILAEEGRVQR